MDSVSNNLFSNPKNKDQEKNEYPFYDIDEYLIILVWVCWSVPINTSYNAIINTTNYIYPSQCEN
jgi:hypothetical protein